MKNILVFGELLYDIYENNAIIGGAPFNYSIQLSRLIANDVVLKFITSIGDDDFGHNATDFISKENIDSSLIQISKQYNTGKAIVFLDENKVPDYTIEENVAWDNIEYSDDISNILKNTNYDLFYFNILSQRNETSYKTIKKIYSNINAKYKVCDVTFRKNYYTKEKIKEAFEFINILKINDDELLTIKELFYPTLENNNELLLKTIQKDFDIEYIFLTLGAQGSAVIHNGEYIINPINKVEVVDTVGAGDAFCAALSYAILKGLKLKDIIKFASNVSEEVVQLKGGTALYDIKKIKNKYNII